MSVLHEEKIRTSVREGYSKVALTTGSGCCCGPSGCDPAESATLEDVSINLGYSKEDVTAVPEGANMGLGCGNPQAIAGLKTGETIVDLGSGGGFDCFLASKQVGVTGKVIGVDMTSEMISKARTNAVKGGYENVEFRLGEIENLPVADDSVDVIISNCVINLSPAKQRVFDDAYRILKNGGRLAVSDVVAITEIPEELKKDVEMYTGCVAGAATIEETKSMLRKSGFSNIQIKPYDNAREVIQSWSEGLPSNYRLKDIVTSASIEAIKV